MSDIQEGIGPMFQCIMGNGHIGTSSCGQNDRQMPVKTLPSRGW